MDVLVVRDPRESRAKCSLTPLRGGVVPGLPAPLEPASEVRFVDYHPDRRVQVGERTLLHPEGELLTPADAGRGLLLVDCSWRRVDGVLRTIEGELVPRRLPSLSTAYPRRSKTFPDPGRGLASIEALFAASVILGEPREAWLAGYRWRAEFLRANAELLGLDAPAP